MDRGGGSPWHHIFRGTKILLFTHLKRKIILFKLCKIFANKVIGALQRQNQ